MTKMTPKLVTNLNLLALVLASGLSLSLLSSCNKSSGANTADTAAAPVDLPTSPNLPGTEATGPEPFYYDQFLFQTQGDCSRPDRDGQLRSLGHLQAIPLRRIQDPRSAVSHDLEAHLLINLYPNGTYASLYTETISGGADHGRWAHDRRGTATPPLIELRLTGLWSAANNQLVLTDLGVGNKYIQGGQNKILFKINRRLNHSEALNSMIVLEPVMSSFGSCVGGR